MYLFRHGEEKFYNTRRNSATNGCLQWGLYTRSRLYCKFFSKSEYQQPQQIEDIVCNSINTSDGDECEHSDSDDPSANRKKTDKENIILWYNKPKDFKPRFQSPKNP